FTDLDPTLTYVVQFINDPAMNMPFTTPNVGDDTTDSDAGDGGITGPINLSSGENNPTIDAGLVNLPASLGDKVFKDLNGDGQQTAGEPGVPGITVNLWTDDDGDGLPDTQIATTTTDANGMYGFANLDPTLTYVVQFINDPAMNMPFTTPNVGDDTTDSDAGDGGITGPITLSSGENNSTIDAGIVNLPAKLGDFVWIDQDRDGVQDAGEPGVPGAVVNLWTDDDGDGQPDTQIATATTDDNGMYMFNGLNSFTVYIVQFEAIPGKPFTTQTAGGDPTVDSNPDVNTGITAPVTLASGEFNPTIDAGVIMLGASIDIEKATNGEDADTPTGPSIIAGDTVNWTYVVTNTGELTVNNVSVSDDQGVTVTCPSDTLAPGASFTCTGSGIAVVGQYANLGSVTGQPVDGGEPVGDPVSDDDPSHYFGEEAVCVDKFVADHFNTVSYGNDDGDMNWSGDWDEHDSQGGGANGGSVRIENGMLVLADYPNSGTDPSISREADTSGFLAAMLMFDWSISEEADHSDQAVIEVRNENIGWTELARYAGNSSSGNGGAAMFDISEFIGTDTQIRFRIAHKFGGNWDKFMVDNVRIDKKCEACTPGDVSDHFNHVSYGNNDGSMNWSGDWSEDDPQGGGAHSGAVRVEDGMLVLTDYPNSNRHPEVRREVDLSGFNAAMLSFDWSISYEADEHDHANLWISSDGGHNWHLLDSYNGVHGQANGNSEMYDISAFISDRTVISFQIGNNFGAVWDKFMVDNVRVDKKCEPTDHVPQSCTANETHYHAFYFPNFNNDGTLDLYDLDDGATFVQADDGTAVLQGTIRKQGEHSYAFNVELTLSGRTDTPPPGSPYNPFGADPSDWQYYPNWTGSLTGIDWNTGAHLSIVRRGASFQIGTGASAHNGEQDNNGGSGWFDWTANGQPNDCAHYGDCISHDGHGDVNVSLHCD
ncbi:MAG: SdrD B-like domain-containing protein, partial [Gammaproteobacteria bacterium]